MRPESVTSIRLLIVFAMMVPGLLGAQADGSGGPLSKFSIHGYLTQAYADAKLSKGGLFSPTADELALGIPEDGTWSYRNMALQFSYEISPEDSFIVQLASRSLGESPINDVEDDIELDWAFYRRKLGPSTSFKVGRVQIPFGIFNQYRDVGTALPFYRAPFVFYQEGSFTSETVDGFMLEHTFAGQSEWNLETSVWIGKFEFFELDFFSAAPRAVKANAEAFGVQLWLNTPVQGLRVGLGGQRRDVTGGVVGVFRDADGTDEFDDWYFSVELLLDNFVFRGEYREFGADPGDIFQGGDFTIGYIQVGFHPSEKFRIYGQAGSTKGENEAEDFAGLLPGPVTEDFSFDLRNEYAIALNYLFAPNIVLKLEHHWVEDAEVAFPVPVITPEGPEFHPMSFNSKDGEFSIVSFSVSF